MTPVYVLAHLRLKFRLHLVHLSLVAAAFRSDLAISKVAAGCVQVALRQHFAPRTCKAAAGGSEAAQLC